MWTERGQWPTWSRSYSRCSASCKSPGLVNWRSRVNYKQSKCPLQGPAAPTVLLAWLHIDDECPQLHMLCSEYFVLSLF